MAFEKILGTINTSYGKKNIWAEWYIQYGGPGNIGWGTNRDYINAIYSTIPTTGYPVKALRVKFNINTTFDSVPSFLSPYRLHMRIGDTESYQGKYIADKKNGVIEFLIQDVADIEEFKTKKSLSLGINFTNPPKPDASSSVYQKIFESFPIVGDDTSVEFLPESWCDLKSPLGNTYLSSDSIGFTWEAGTYNSSKQASFKIYTSKDGAAYTLTKEGVGETQNTTIQSNTFSQGSYKYKVEIAFENGLKSTSDIGSFNVCGVPTVSNIELNQLSIDNPIAISWRSSYQTAYEVEVYQNNVKVKTYTANTTTPSRTIPVGDIVKVGSTSFRVRVSNTFGGRTIWTSWTERNFTLTRIIPRITNFNVLDNFFEKDIRTNWRGENQSRYEFEILKDNARVNLFTGNKETAFIVPNGTLTSSGDYVFRVRPIYVPTWSTTDLSYGEWVEKNVKLVEIVPTVSNLVLSGSNIDLALSLSWDATDQEKFEAQVYKGDILVDTQTGSTGKSVSYSPNTLTTGLHKFRVRIAYKDRWTDWKEVSATLSETLPSIGAFEPDGVIVDRDNPIRIWWTSLNQSKWKLVIDDNSTYQGSSETEYIVSAGTLQTGTHKIVLTVTYVTPSNVEKVVSKKAEFIVQGKPPIPTITSIDSFEVSRPLITWDSSDQQGYILEVLKDNSQIYTTEWQNGLVNSHKIMEYLQDGLYTVRIKIINQFGMESDWGYKHITIITIKESSILLRCTQIGESINLKWDNNDNKFSKFYVLRNGKVIAKTTTPTFYDYTSNGECMYAIRGITERDVYIDSNICFIDYIINGGFVATIDKLDDMMNVGISRNEYQFGGNLGLEHELVYLSGREYPVSIFGEHATETYSFKFNTKDKLFRFLDMCRRRQVFCYRDKRQTLYLTIPNLNFTFDKFGMEYSIQATQVDYSEAISYD